jgi:hypothetical protein
MNRFWNQTVFVILLLVLISAGCSNSPQPSSSSGGVTLAPSSASNSVPASGVKDSQVNACNFLSVADAQTIDGAPMKISPITHSSDVCEYVEVTPKANAMGPAHLSLTLNQRKSVEEENKDWARLKEVRNLEPGFKNLRVLTGLGDESYFTGNTEKGMVGVAAVIVRKGRSHFTLDSQVIEYRASPDAMKSVAKRIVDQMP